MLHAAEAGRLTDQAAKTKHRKDAIRRRIATMKRTSIIKEKIPEYLEEAEKSVQGAISRSERSVRLLEPILQTEDCKLALLSGLRKSEDSKYLIAPYRRFVSLLEQAGYKVSFKYEFEPYRAEWCYIVLSW